MLTSPSPLNVLNARFRVGLTRVASAAHTNQRAMFTASLSAEQQREMAKRLTGLLSRYRHISDSQIIVRMDRALLWRSLVLSRGDLVAFAHYGFHVAMSNNASASARGLTKNRKNNSICWLVNSADEVHFISSFISFYVHVFFLDRSSSLKTSGTLSPSAGSLRCRSCHISR